MSCDEIKIWATNIIVTLVTFTNIDNLLKLILLLITIGYTADKWLLMRKNKKNDNE